MGNRVTYFGEVKRLEREADQTPNTRKCRSASLWSL